MSPDPADPRRIMILIPAYNEVDSIAGVVQGCRQWGLPVVVVDDGSSDGTGDSAESAGAKVVRRPRNMGKGAALAAGFEYAERNGFEAVVTLDGDGQHDPAEIGRFLEEYRESGADVVVGTRMKDIEVMPWIRRLTNRLTSLVISRITGQRITDSQCGYRAITTRAWREIGPLGARFDAESEFLLRTPQLGLVVREVPISTIYGTEVSKISPVRDTWRFIKVSFRVLMSRHARRGGGDAGEAS